MNLIRHAQTGLSTFLAVIACAGLGACGAAGAAPDTPASHDVSPLAWSDGDSRYFADGTPFRLANIDAPETGGVGAAIGGAACEMERTLGAFAEEWVDTVTRGAIVTVSADYGAGGRGRHVVDLVVDGRDLAEMGLAAGHYRSWRHDTPDRPSKALEQAPDWCR